VASRVVKVPTKLTDTSAGVSQLLLSDFVSQILHVKDVLVVSRSKFRVRKNNLISTRRSKFTNQFNGESLRVPSNNLLFSASKQLLTQIAILQLTPERSINL